MPKRLYITTEELEERIDSIVEEYDKGDNTEYVIDNKGKQVLLTPFDGPWTVTVVEDDDGELVLPIPDRICALLDIKIGDAVDFKSSKEGIYLRKATEEVREEPE